MTTKNASDETAVEALKLGAFDYIKKPIDYRIFNRMVSTALEMESIFFDKRLINFDGQFLKDNSAEPIPIIPKKLRKINKKYKNSKEKEEESNFVKSISGGLLKLEDGEWVKDTSAKPKSKKVDKILRDVDKKAKKYKSEIRNYFDEYQQDQRALLEAKEEELTKEIFVRKETEESMQRMVAQYSHALNNTLFPERLLDVADQLKNPEVLDKENFHKLSLELRKAYQAEVLVKHNSELMIAQQGSDGGQNFRRFILKDRLKVNTQENSVSATNILDDALEKVIGRLLNKNDVKLESARDHLIQKNGTELEKINIDYEERVLIKNEMKPLEWIDSKLAKTTFGKTTPMWEKVCLRMNGCAHALLLGHWAEIIFNALKYTDFSKNKFLKLSFKEHSDEDYTWLRMIWENPSSDQGILERIERDGVSTIGAGLKGIIETLSNLNKLKSNQVSVKNADLKDSTHQKEFPPKNTLEYEFKNNHFYISLNYRIDMLVHHDQIL